MKTCLSFLRVEGETNAFEIAFLRHNGGMLFAPLLAQDEVDHEGPVIVPPSPSPSPTSLMELKCGKKRERERENK